MIVAKLTMKRTSSNLLSANSRPIRPTPKFAGGGVQRLSPDPGVKQSRSLCDCVRTLG
jgi:hypothetical protein